MKKLLKLIANNWLTKLVSLLLAILIWFLIRQQLIYTPSTIREPVPNAQWTD